MKLAKTLVATLTGLGLAWSAQAADYQVDPAHSAVTFEAGHLGFSLTPGQFKEFSGAYSFSAEDLSDAKVSFEISTASVDTNHEARDKHLRSPDFFDVKQHPSITFSSTGYQGNGEAGKLEGQMTLLGVTKPVTFDVKVIGEGTDPWGGYRHGLTATTTIKRSDFGMNYFIPGVADEVALKVFIEGIRQ